MAATRERGKAARVATLSRHVWAWFAGWKRGVLAAFLAAVFAHLVFEASAWGLITAVPFAAVIVDAVWWGGRNAMLFEGTVKKLAIKLGLRWLEGAATKARKEGSQAMKMLDGWKTLISAVVWIGVMVFALVTGQDIAPIARGIAEALQWETPTGETVVFYGLIANFILALWGSGGKVWKAYQQRKAGATASELLGPIGFMKAASVDGTMTSATRGPVVLLMTDAPPKADDVPVTPVAASVIVSPTPKVAPPETKKTSANSGAA